MVNYGEKYISVSPIKSVLVLLLIAAFGFSANAKHITGGEMIYDYIGRGTAAGTSSYQITLRLFRDENCFSCATMPTSVIIGLFDSGSGAPIGTRTVNISSTNQLPLNGLPPCITNPPTLVYTVGLYTFNIDLPDNTAGYTAAYQTCCRIDGIENVPNSVGATYTTQIPGMTTMGNVGDNSPRFSQGISVVCYNKPFTLDFSSVDPDGDVLVYSLCDAYNGGAASNANPVTPAAPPYGFVNYINGYSGVEPLGSLASIDAQTGIISGIAPDAGKYVVSVCVTSYNSATNQFKSVHRKDFIITVAPCDFAGAQLQPSYISCDGFDFQFENLNTSPLNLSFLWDFGDGTTSTEASPAHRYSAAGVYTLKLVVNPGGACSDSTSSELKVFPGFFPAISDNAPMCKSIPVQFADATTLNYGAVNYWRWDFGNTAVSNDTSRLRNPSYTYNNSGSYTVTLTVGSDRGCRDTITKIIEIVDKPDFAVTNDTLICAIDTLRLSAVASSGGSITWSPNYMIDNVNSFTPLVSPDVTTTYMATYSDAFGCSATEPITVRVVNNVSLSLSRDTTICLTDEVQLFANSDALKYVWSPGATLSDATLPNPIATPTAATTSYSVIASIGKCTAQGNVTIGAVPYPRADAGKDSTICFGQSVQLTASGGSIYTWSPPRFLSASNISNPVSQSPRADIAYIVEVKDVLGCPKPAYDTVLIQVAKIIADAGPRDTSIVLGQPLQLNATGSTNFSWTPPTWLNDVNISNPLSLPQENIEYVVKVSNPQGCFALDTIAVKVFKIDPDLLVPTGFSPDNDGNNDIFRPILVGMKSLDAFRVYNRWGQLLFSTTTAGVGWDGRFVGQEQGPGTYVWYAEGTNYLGKKIEKKGTVILIR